MKTKKFNKKQKLSLSKVTIAHLREKELRDINGGGVTDFCPSLFYGCDVTQPTDTVF
jgi:hypothetical protein